MKAQLVRRRRLRIAETIRAWLDSDPQILNDGSVAEKLTAVVALLQKFGETCENEEDKKAFEVMQMLFFYYSSLRERDRKV